MSVNFLCDDQIAVLVLDRPASMNALNEQVLEDLNQGLDQVQAGIQARTCRGLVVAGAGEKAFCAGADIAQLAQRDLAQHRRNVHLGQATFDRIAALAIPSVAVLHGYAFGGGLELALACTFRIATPKAQMGLPEVKLGLIPGYGGTQRLPRLVGAARALELILSGQVIGADEAYRIGLVNRVVEAGDPLALGKDYLRQFCAPGALAIRLALESVQRGLDGDLGTGLGIEADLFALCSQSRDAVEGMAAFLEKRKPGFKGE